MQLELPTEKEAEALILGRMMNSNDSVNEAIDKLTVDHFALPEHKEIFVSMKSLYSKNHAVEMDAVFRQLASPERKKLDYLSELFCKGMGSCDLSYYLELLDNAYKKRSLLLACNTIFGNYKNNAEELYHDLIKKLDAVFNGNNFQSYHSAAEIIDGSYPKDSIPLMEHIQKRTEMALLGDKMITGYQTTYPILDDVLDGLQMSHYIIVGARSGTGKTTFILNLISRLLKQDLSIGFFSLEMTAQQLIQKLLCISSFIDDKKIRNGLINEYELEKLYEASEKIKKTKLYIDDQAGLKISQLVSRAKRMKASQGIDILFIDYIGEISGDIKYSTKQEERQAVSKKIRCLAKDLNIPIVCIAQLNRQNEIQKRPPIKSDLRESGQLEADAHSILLLHKPDESDQYDKPGILEVHIVKNRFGEQKKIQYNFNGKNGYIEELKTIQEVKEELKLCSPEDF